MTGRVTTTRGMGRLQEVEDLITRKRMVILYIGFYLALVSTALRGLNYYFLEKISFTGGASDWVEEHEYRWLVLGLLLAFVVLAVARHWRPSQIAGLPHLYLAVQSPLVFPLLLIPESDYFTILFFLLSLQTMLSLRQAVGYLWLTAFALLTAVGFLVQYEFRTGLALLGIYTAGYYFFGSFATATAQAERTRYEAQEALAELRQREKQLIESEERYRRLVEGSPDAVVVFDRNFRFVDVNTSACRSLGYQREELIGMPLQTIYPGFVGEDGEAMQRHMEIEPEDWHFHLEETELRRQDGTTFLAESHIGPIEIDGRRHLIALVRDVTERKETEETVLAQTRDLAVLEERNRMAREIHNTLAQGFTGVVLQLEAAEQVQAEDQAAVAGHLRTAKSLARSSLQEARRSVWNLMPEALSGSSLEGALRREIERSLTSARHGSLSVSGSRLRLSPDIEAALLRICQESLTNVNRHAAANNVRVNLRFDDTSVVLSIEGDGVGFDHDRASEGNGLGLRGMSERTRLLGGRLVVKTEPGQGTTVEASVPLSPSRAG